MGEEWLLCYHGKENSEAGYGQSLMILEQPPDSLPVVKHRCSTPLLVPEEDWEMPGNLSVPVIFVTGMIPLGDQLLLSYGAADERIGIALMDFAHLVEYVRRFDADGRCF